jgi:hypothetical protein
MRELQQYGAKVLESQMRKKLSEVQNKYGTERARIDYCINVANIKLFDPQMVAFLQINLNVRNTIYI